MTDQGLPDPAQPNTASRLTRRATSPDGPRVVIAGAGLAGLTAAVSAARLGARVTVLDARSEIGGRARSHPAGGSGDALFNEGPHALYAGGEARATLADFGIHPSGGKPAVPIWVEHDGELLVFPTGPRDAIRRSTVKVSAMAAVGRLVVLGRGPEPVVGQSMAEWISAATGNPESRALLGMLARVATYCDDMDAISSTIAVSQVRSAARPGVLYIDRGWQSMVDALERVAVAAGVDIRTGCKATAVSGVGSEAGITVSLAGNGDSEAVVQGEAEVRADAVVIASGGPATARDLLLAGGNRSLNLEHAASRAAPVRATTLDVHLSKLPRPDRRVCFPTGEPLYLSVHTPSADLARTGEVMHLMWYGEHDDSVRPRIEEFAERVQPGWRDHVLAERFGRSMVVANDRPNGHDTTTVEVADSPGVLVAGDWVYPTPNVLLADAAVLSGRRAGEAATTGSQATSGDPDSSGSGARRAAHR